MSDHSDHPDTMRSCEACGGDDNAPECLWCSGGYQTAAQAKVWRQVRDRMRHISGTYGFLEAINEDLLERLEGLDTKESLTLQEEGLVLLEAWRAASPINGGRDVYTELLKTFNRQAIDLLMGPK